MKQLMLNAHAPIDGGEAVHQTHNLGVSGGLSGMPGWGAFWRCYLAECTGKPRARRGKEIPHRDLVRVARKEEKRPRCAR
jgi:hypothetical protein